MNDGGPAFPVTFQHVDQLLAPESRMEHNGMTLRDYFASKALEGFCCNQAADFDANVAAEISYEIADAMLAARDRVVKRNGEVGP